MTAMQFNRQDSPTGFSQLDFRAKLVFMLAILLSSALWENLWLSAVLAVIVGMLVRLSNLDRTFVRNLLLISLPFYGFIVLMQAWFGGPLVSLRLGVESDMLTAWFSLPAHWPIVGGWGMTLEGTLYGMSVVFKTFTLSLLLPLVLLSSDANAVVASLVKLGLPYKLAFIFSATLRFFPLLLDESRAIIEAQQLRGVDVASMGMLRKIRTYAKIAVPLILGAYSRSQYLEMVLQAKGFPGVEKRTYLYDAHLRRFDWFVMLSALVFAICVLTAYIMWGVGKFNGMLWIYG